MKRIMAFLAVLFLVFFFGTICYADSYETEPNNDKSQADALASGVPTIGQLSSNNDQDWYSICTSDADVINVKFSLEPAYILTVFYITIQDSLGNVLANKDFIVASNNDPQETTFSSAVNSSGIYYVVITSSGDIGYDANYTLTTTVSNPGACPTEPPKYDFTGIWQIEGQQYFISVNVNGSTMVGVTYIPGAGESFWVGYGSGENWYIYYASNFSQFEAYLILTSDTTGMMAVSTCVPFSGENCLIPLGTTVNITKIF
jgi:hypothetical protein